MNIFSKIATVLLLAATLLLQGCATGGSNLLCADGCRNGTPTADTQWSQQLGDNLYVHPQFKDLYVHQVTQAWEPSLTCGSPGLLRTLSYSLLGGAISGIAYKTVSNPYAAGAIGGAANGVIGQINQSGLNKVCRDAATVAAQHNARPEISREIIRWTVRKNLETAKIQQEVTNEEMGQQQPVGSQQIAAAQSDPTATCVADANRSQDGINKMAICAKYSLPYGLTTNPQGQQGCGCIQ